MKIFVPVVLLLVVISFATSHPVVVPAAAGGLAQQPNDDRSTAPDMEPSESKVKKFYKRPGYGYGGYALPLFPRFYPTAGATVLVGYPLLTGYGGYYGHGGYGGYGGVIPALGYGYGR